MSTRVSNDQLEALLEFLKEHPALAKGVGLGSRSKATVEKLWNDLAQHLNAFGSGSTKSGERWKKYWTDLKHKSKTRVAKRRREALGTGGGPGSQDDLTEIDKKVLAIIGEQAVFGDSEHRIPLSHTEAETQEQSNDVLPVQVAVPLEYEVDILPIAETRHPIASSSPVVNSPSRRGHTTQVYTCNSTNQNTSFQTQPAPQTQSDRITGHTSPVNRPRIDRPRRRIRLDNATGSSRITPEWVKDLESRRVDAEAKLASAALLMAEASRVQADAAQTLAGTMRELVGLVHQQSEDIRALLEMTRPIQNR